MILPSQPMLDILNARFETGKALVGARRLPRQAPP
jgi:hypothetical protein